MAACARCHGLMVFELVEELPCWRCIACGNILDAVIIKNRTIVPEELSQPYYKR